MTLGQRTALIDRVGDYITKAAPAPPNAIATPNTPTLAVGIPPDLLVEVDGAADVELARELVALETTAGAMLTADAAAEAEDKVVGGAADDEGLALELVLVTVTTAWLALERVSGITNTEAPRSATSNSRFL
ncbi:hypothetical protein EHS25_002608 [Saitozyma podzolica]|uniref:Uncharacterized protein n=1 Tax=Saitozyma podzolica TaxID=1890683 RepID=A0A427YCZ6_9TREE|nr:hypothetical protein EHS25_002608 [Saitozyma podzolica]